MAPQVMYKCPLCKMTRGSYREAARCEKSHLAAVSIRSADYMLGPYPFRVALTFPDGAERWYIVDEGIFFGNGVYNYEDDKDAGTGKGRKGT